MKVSVRPFDFKQWISRILFNTDIYGYLKYTYSNFQVAINGLYENISWKNQIYTRIKCYGCLYYSYEQNYIPLGPGGGG